MPHSSRRVVCKLHMCTSLDDYLGSSSTRRALKGTDAGEMIYVSQTLFQGRFAQAIHISTCSLYADRFTNNVLVIQGRLWEWRASRYASTFKPAIGRVIHKSSTNCYRACIWETMPCACHHSVHTRAECFRQWELPALVDPVLTIWVRITYHRTSAHLRQDSCSEMLVSILRVRMVLRPPGKLKRGHLRRRKEYTHSTGAPWSNISYGSSTISTLSLLRRWPCAHSGCTSCFDRDAQLLIWQQYNHEGARGVVFTTIRGMGHGWALHEHQHELECHAWLYRSKAEAETTRIHRRSEMRDCFPTLLAPQPPTTGFLRALVWQQQPKQQGVLPRAADCLIG